MGKPHAWVPEDNENRLAEFRTAAGFSLPELAKRTGTSYSGIRALELCETRLAYKRNGKIKPWAEAACKVLGKRVEDVFPNEFCTLDDGTGLITEDRYPGIFHRQDEASIEDILDARAALRYIMNLHPRIGMVIKLRANGYTLKETGEIMERTIERIRQMEAKGLRKIRQRFGFREE